MTMMEQLINVKDLENKSDIKILVVDDREDNLFSIETILEKENYSVVKANSGRSALKILLNEHDFSLILMDVQMPDMTGFETANLIYQRDKLKDIPIIFITAHNYHDEYVFKGYQMGAVDYIYKPINPDLLIAKVGVFAELYRKNLKLLANERKLIRANENLRREVEERKISEMEIRMLNKQLTENNNHLRAVNEELDRFAFVASHDLQEPLRKIMLFSDKILKNEEQQEEEKEKYLQKIISSSQRMQGLIIDLLRFSRHDAYASDFIEADLNNIVHETLLELEMEIERSKARITVDPLPRIYVIPVLIRQLFYNLIGNAIKFRKTNGIPVIKITSEKIKTPANLSRAKHNRSSGFYRISISDNGIGFDPKYADDIFVVFKRLHSYHEYEGSGVGLSICKKIMEKHSGYITAHGNLNVGATFEVCFPEKQIMK
jgi:signal transduction histidine kinase